MYFEEVHLGNNIKLPLELLTDMSQVQGFAKIKNRQFRPIRKSLVPFTNVVTQSANAIVIVR